MFDKEKSFRIWKRQDKLKWLCIVKVCCPAMLHSNKYRSLFIVNNTEYSCYPFPMLPGALSLNLFLLFFYYLTSNHFTKSSLWLPPSILFFYCCMTNCYKLKQCVFIISVSESEVQPWLSQILCLGPQKDAIEVLGCIHIWKWLGGKSAPKPIQIVVRICFIFAVCGPSYFVGCQMEASLTS